MNRGYVKLHRKLMDSQVFQNEGLLKVCVWCLLKANHKEAWVSIKTGRGKTEVYVKPGQFIFGRKTAAKELRMNPSTVQKRILKLKKVGFCITQSNTHYSIITIVNWDTYQVAAASPLSREVSGKYQPSITNKNDKNDKNKESAAKILSLLNDLSGKRFKCIDRNLTPISARIREYSEADCETVLQGAWKDPKFDKKYFQPSTLFRPANFENYINRYHHTATQKQAGYKEAH